MSENERRLEDAHESGIREEDGNMIRLLAFNASH